MPDSIINLLRCINTYMGYTFLDKRNGTYLQILLFQLHQRFGRVHNKVCTLGPFTVIFENSERLNQYTF